MAQFRRRDTTSPARITTLLRWKTASPGRRKVRRTGVSGTGRGLGAERRLSRHHSAGHPAQRGYILPFWICPQPATRRMSSRCPTARPCWTRRSGKRRAPSGRAAPPALPGMWWGITALTSPLPRAIGSSSAIWPYSTCKNNTFNGMPLPHIWLLGAAGNCRELVHFGYQDFKMRLGAQ